MGLKLKSLRYIVRSMYVKRNEAIILKVSKFSVTVESTSNTRSFQSAANSPTVCTFGAAPPAQWPGNGANCLRQTPKSRLSREALERILTCFLLRRQIFLIRRRPRLYYFPLKNIFTIRFLAIFSETL